MPRKFIIPILGSLTAIAITSVMDFTGLSVYSALPLFPLLIVFSVVEKIRRRELGFCFGKWSDYCNAAWHLSAVTFNTGFDVPARQIPILLLTQR
jgi:hypothetical protein